MGITHVAKLIAFGLIGLGIGAYLPLIGFMIFGAVIGNWIGQRTLSRMPERLFRRLFQVLLTLLAIRLLFSAIMDQYWINLW